MEREDDIEDLRREKNEIVGEWGNHWGIKGFPCYSEGPVEVG